MIERPLINGWCENCKHRYLLDGDEERCRRINVGMSHMMCVQVAVCPYFTLKEGKKVE